VEGKVAGNGWKVLLIDDDPGICKVMGITLDDAGYEVLTAPDGESGVELCGRFIPDIVITDVRLPGIDGIEVLRRIKGALPDVEVIVVTAFSEIGLALQALHLDASDFITKPIGEDALTVALSRAKKRIVTRKELKDYTALIEERWMQTAEELAKTFDIQKSLIESSIDGIAAYDSDGKVMIFNKSMERMLGYARQEVIGKMFLDQFFSPGEAEKFFDKLISKEYGGSRRLFLFETVLADKTGARIPCQVSASEMMQGTEEVGMVVFFRDQREIRGLMQEVADQARFLQQDKMISLGRLAASVVHEINNPLSGILNYTRLMARVLAKGALATESVTKFQGYLSLMDSELSRCSKIVSNLLAFSRQSNLESAPVKVNELLGRSITLCEHKLNLQNIEIKTALSSEDPVVAGDFNQLQQCLINLIFNAMDAMPGGGVLTVESAPIPTQKIVEIRVRDTGCGIAKEDLIYIFDPFFTTKKEGKGLGLGLSTSYGIIDRHHGAISVETETGKGTAFIIKLPLQR
jgi:two-component system, NtrC family, sensor kinase